MDAVDTSLMARIAFGLCGLIAVITLIAALRMYIPLFWASESATASPSSAATLSRWTPQPEDSESEHDAVRISNPFDASEVFEYPAGTSPADARAAMAETLLERARDRYAQIDSRSAAR
jgi:hypothetical protein